MLGCQCGDLHQERVECGIWQLRRSRREVSSSTQKKIVFDLKIAWELGWYLHFRAKITVGH